MSTGSPLSQRAISPPACAAATRKAVLPPLAAASVHSAPEGDGQMATAAAMTYATTDKIGFWRRFGAIVIDIIAVGIVSSVLNALVFGGDQAPRNGLTTPPRLA